MFTKSISASWTYVAIVARVGGGHNMQQFTLPSNQTQYENNNNMAARYYCQNLNIHEDFMEGCVAIEDYDMDPPRVGISLSLAVEQRRDRQRQFDEGVKHGKFGADIGKNDAFVTYINDLDNDAFSKFLKNRANRGPEINKEVLEDRDELETFDEAMEKIYASKEFQDKFKKLQKDLILAAMTDIFTKLIDETFEEDSK